LKPLVLAAFYAFLNLNLSQEFLKKSFFARKTGRDFANIAFAGSVSRKGQTQTLFLHPIAELPRRRQDHGPCTDASTLGLVLNQPP
jgi:hypothetical protein